MTDEELTQAMAELQEVVRCRCDEAYKDRGLKDPYCECDSAEAVKVVASRIEALTAELATCEKYRDAYDEMGRIGTQAVRDLEAKLEKAVEALERAKASIENGGVTDVVWLDDPCPETLCDFIAATLAEIKGESHD